MKRYWLVAAVFVAAAFAACGGGGGSGPASQVPLAAPASTMSANGQTSAIIHIHITPTATKATKHASSTRRSPKFYDSNETTGLQIEDDYTDATGAPHQAFVYANVSPGSVLCPAATTSGGYDCSIAAPAYPGVLNTYNVSAGFTSITNLAASGYGTAISNYQMLETGSATMTPAAGTVTAVAMVLNAVSPCMEEDSTGQFSGDAATLTHPANFVDYSITGNPNRYVVVADSVSPVPQSDIVAVDPLDYCDTLLIAATPGAVYAVPSPLPSGHTPGPNQSYAQSTAQPYVLVTPPPGSGLTAVATTSLSTLTTDGRIRVQFTYDGHTTTESRFIIQNGIASNVVDMFGNNYDYNQEGAYGSYMTYAIEPFSVTPQTASLSASTTSAVLTLNEPGVTGFTSSTGTSSGSCVDAGMTTLATFSISGFSGTSASLTLTYVATPTPGDTCTFQVKDNIGVLSAAIKVTVN